METGRELEFINRSLSLLILKCPSPATRERVS